MQTSRTNAVKATAILTIITVSFVLSPVPADCWPDEDGSYHYTYGDIVYNTWYADKHSGREPGYVVSPGYLPTVALHENFHSIGGDHLDLDTSNPPSVCNLSFWTMDPFVKGGRCEAMAGSVKPGDVAELQRHYPAPASPPQNVYLPPGMLPIEFGW